MDDVFLGDCLYVRPPRLNEGELPLHGCIQLHVKQKPDAEMQNRPFIVIRPDVWMRLKKHMAELERLYPASFLEEGETAESKILEAWKKEIEDDSE